MSCIPIFLSSDNNYAPYIATAIASICDNTKSFCNFYILDDGISKENKSCINSLKKFFKNFSIEYITINLEKEFNSIEYKNVGNYISLSTYNRFLIPKLKPQLKKVLYLDVDIVVLGDIQELYNEDLEGYALGAVWEQTRKYYNSDTKELMGLSENYKYFNAGILVIDVQKWLDNNILKELFYIEKIYRENVLHADETLLNKYFDNNYKILPIKYNYTDYDTIVAPIKDIVIRHFATSIKPWQINPNTVELLCPNLQDFWHYAMMTPFYNCLLQKCQDENSQKQINRKLQLQKVILKSFIPKVKELC